MNRKNFLRLSVALPFVQVLPKAPHFSGLTGRGKDSLYTATKTFLIKVSPHTFSKVGEGIARMIITFQPAGRMEEFFISVAKGILKGKSEKEQDDFRKAHGFERVGPALDYFKKF